MSSMGSSEREADMGIFKGRRAAKLTETDRLIALASMDLESVIAWILRDNCLDCFHAECLERCDLVEDLRRMERGSPARIYCS